MRVISLQETGTDWYIAKWVEVVYKSAHNCNGSDAKEEVDDENDIDKEFDEAREAKYK